MRTDKLATALLAMTFALSGCGGGGTTVDTSDPSEQPLLSQTKVYREAEMLYMEREKGSERSRIGLDLQRGGMVTEASLNGVNVVNAFDTGRGIQIALYDGAYHYDACAGCGGSWGWNPVQGGDKFGHGSRVTSIRIESDAITVRTRPLQWVGVGGEPTPSDVVIEQRVSTVDSDLSAFRVDYRIEIEGSTPRQIALQELPAAYAGTRFSRLMTYDGMAPWTGGAASEITLLPLGQTPVRSVSSERWFALVNEHDFGLTIYAPASGSFVSGFVAPDAPGVTGSGTAFARLDAPLALLPGKAVSGSYVIAIGDWRRARETIYRLRANGE